MAKPKNPTSTTDVCAACGGATPPGAVFCPSCGNRLVTAAAPAAVAPAAPPPADFAAEFDARDSQTLSREMYARHLELLRRYRGRLRDLERRAAARGERLDALERAPLSPETTRAVQDELLEVEDLGDRWETLQHDYNHDSEAIDEEFLDRFSEIEMDVDLPENLQLEINGELEAMNGELEALGRTLGALGTRGESLLARAQGRWTTLRPRATGPLELALLVLAGGAGLALALWEPGPWAPVAGVLLPVVAWAGTLLASSSARS